MITPKSSISSISRAAYAALLYLAFVHVAHAADGRSFISGLGGIGGLVKGFLSLGILIAAVILLKVQISDFSEARNEKDKQKALLWIAVGILGIVLGLLGLGSLGIEVFSASSIPSAIPA